MKYYTMIFFVVIISMLSGASLVIGLQRTDLFLVMASFLCCAPITVLSRIAELAASEQSGPFQEDFK